MKITTNTLKKMIIQEILGGGGLNQMQHEDEMHIAKREISKLQKLAAGVPTREQRVKIINSARKIVSILEKGSELHDQSTDHEEPGWDIDTSVHPDEY